MLTAKEIEYIKSKMDELDKVKEKMGEHEEIDGLKMMYAKQIFYYALNHHYCIDDDCDDEEITCGHEDLIEELKEYCKDEYIIEYLNENFIGFANKIQEFQQKLDNDVKFGTELEYTGRGGFVDCSESDDMNAIVQCEKHDGSVAGSGREYNLKPFNIYDAIAGKTSFKKRLEKFMKKNANECHCTTGASAGEHIHYSYEGIEIRHGAHLIEAINEVMDHMENTYSDRKFFKDVWAIKKFQERKDIVNSLFESGEWIQGKFSKNNLYRSIKLYEAFQYIYSVSNRTGEEHYGLGRDITRGYTCHGTIELRAWRTTLDYRTVCARAWVGWTWLKWIIEKSELDRDGFVDWEYENVWDIARSNERIKLLYKYLAFNCDNPHKTGLSEQQLLEIFGEPKSFASAVKNRSRIFKKQLITANSEAVVKKMFNEI